MDNILFSTSEMWKAVIFPEESGIYKATINNNVFYILVEDSCINDVQLKWLGSNGFYKHGVFIPYTSEKWNPKDGLSVEIFNYNLSGAVSFSSLISKENSRTITLRKVNVPTDIYKMYMDLAKSPKVYLNVGDGVNDKWIEVTVKWNPVFDSKKDFHQMTVEIKLPDDTIQKL